MEGIALSAAAERLGVHPSRVRQLVHEGQLRGQRIGSSWLVSASDVAERAERRPLPGRPLAPARAWALLDLLDGGNAPWLSPVARSQVRQALRALTGANEQRWRAALRGRSQVLALHAHPAAVRRVAAHPGVLEGGPARAVAAGVDLVALEAPAELYVPESDWPGLAARYRLGAELGNGAGISNDPPNLIIHIPAGIWPFAAGQGVGPAALAADLLGSAEPRARSGGVARLNELAARVPHRASPGAAR